MFRTFTERRARKEQEEQRELSVRLRSPEPEVRAAAAGEVARVRDTAWAIRELAQALCREPSPATFDGISGPFCDALSRDEDTRRRVERLLASHPEDIAALVRDWTAFLAEHGAGNALERVDEELAEEVGGRLRRLREGGANHRELGRLRPDSFEYTVALGAAVALIQDAVMRTTPLAADAAERARKELREAFERALPHSPASDERTEILAPLCERPSVESWTDHALATLRIEETLGLCASADPERVALGVEALTVMLHHNDVRIHDAVRETLDRLCVPNQEPFTLSKVLSCYAGLHSDRSLDDPPVGTFLAALEHSDPRVRANAAAGLDTIAPGLPEESQAVAAMIEAMDHDPDIEVVRSAAYALAVMKCAEEANSRAASAALAGHADSADPSMRLASLEGAIGRGEPGGYDRLSAELQRLDVEARFVSSAGYFRAYEEVPKDVLGEWTRLLERLRQDDWVDRPNQHEDGDDTDPAFRMFMLERTLEILRTHA